MGQFPAKNITWDIRTFVYLLETLADSENRIAIKKSILYDNSIVSAIKVLKEMLMTKKTRNIHFIKALFFVSRQVNKWK